MLVIQHKSEEGKKKALVLLKSLQVWSLRVVPSRKTFEQISGAMEKSVSFKKTGKVTKREKCVKLQYAETYKFSWQDGSECSDKLL